MPLFEAIINCEKSVIFLVNLPLYCYTESNIWIYNVHMLMRQQIVFIIHEERSLQSSAIRHLIYGPPDSSRNSDCTASNHRSGFEDPRNYL